MSKRSLLLSTAVVAVLAGPAFADTSIDKSTSTALATSTAGNVTIVSGGSINVSNGSTGAIKVDSSNFVSSAGAIANKDSTDAAGIVVDMTKNPSPLTNSANTSALGIDLASGSSLVLSGSGTGKSGIWLQNTNITAGTTYTYTGPINLEAGSTVNVTGDTSQGVIIDSNSVLNGNLTLAGTIAVTPASTTTTSPVNTYGVISDGLIQGNVSVPSGGSIAVTGAGATAMSIQGSGVTGSISIGGGLVANGQSANTNITNLYKAPKYTGNPDAGPGLSIGASVGGGIAILGPTATSGTTTAGSISVQGAAPALYISPAANLAIPTQTAPLNIGVFSDTADPGFSIYNRGSLATTPANLNEGATAVHIAGSGSTYPTNIAGGFYNSGGITATGSTTGNVANGISVTSVFLDNYAIFDGVSTSYNYNTNPGADTTLANKNGPVANDPGDKAAFVNSSITGSGTISATSSGSRGGVATAIYINSLADVPSIINTGTITASSTTTDATLAGNISSSSPTPLAAWGIHDLSGSLTSIYNGGTISAVAGVTGATSSGVSALDNNSQVGRAIDLSAGTPQSASGQGVSIINQSSLTKAATITGDVLFGSGNNQILTLQGNGATLPSTLTGNVTFGLKGIGSGNGGGSGDQLNIGNYSVLTGSVTTLETTSGSGVAVDIADHGNLNILNTSTALNATTFHVASGGTVSLGVSEALTSSGVVAASNSINLDSGAILGVAYSSFVPQLQQGQTADSFVLMTASKGGIHIDPNTINIANTALQTNIGQQGGSLPYLFKSANLAIDTTSSTSVDKLVLSVVPKTATDLGLTGYAAQIFPYANTALGIDDVLGSAMINGIHNQAQAQAAYDSFAPNVTGGTRAIAISITDQATGVVGAHQRALRMYGKESGSMTLWGDEFVQMIKDPGQGATDPTTHLKAQPGFKDHGFGFAVGLDGGSPKYGWYGGAFTFYAGDVGELARDSHENQQWYVLSGYTTWRGKGMFFDSKLDVGYGHIDGKRFINLIIPSSVGTTVYTREADNKHAGLLLSGGMSTGAMFSYGAMTLMPQLSVDGLLLREEGYTETNPGTATVGDAFDLTVQPYYAQSLRAFIGGSVRYDLNLWDFYLQPEARLGYRYDFFNDPVKLKAAFAHADTSGGTAVAGTQFLMQGPDPSQGNFVAGGTLAATTDTWTLGLNFDLVRGTNGSFEQVGTVNLLGRI